MYNFTVLFRQSTLYYFTLLFLVNSAVSRPTPTQGNAVYANLMLDKLPDSGSCESFCSFNSVPLFLPPDVEHVVLHQLVSLKDISACLQVCKRWNKEITQNVLNVSAYSSSQDFLQQLIQDAIPTGKVDASFFTNILGHAPLNGSSCSVSQRLWFQAAVKYGHIAALDQWYSQATIEDKVDVFSFPEETFQLVKHSPHASQVILWYLDKLQELDVDAVGIWEVKVLGVALELGLDSVVYDDKLEFALSHQHPLQLLEHAAASPNKTLWDTIRTNALDRMTLSAHHYVENALANCLLCNMTDIQAMLHRFDAREQDQVCNNAIQAAARRGNSKMVQLLLSHCPNIDMDHSLLKSAAFSGNMELVSFLQQRRPVLRLNHQTIQQFIQSSYPVKLNVLNQWIQSTHELDHTLAETLIQMYAKRACGNIDDVAALKTLLAVDNMTLPDNFLQTLVERPDLPGAWESQSPVAHFNTQPIACPKNESIQLIQFALNELGFKPNQTVLNYCIKRGRLDLVKLVYEQGLKMGSPLLLNEASLDLLVGFHGSHTWKERSFQEPLLIDYIMNEILKSVSPLDRPAHRHRILSDFKSRNKRFMSQFDCYDKRILELL